MGSRDGILQVKFLEHERRIRHATASRPDRNEMCTYGFFLLVDTCLNVLLLFGSVWTSLLGFIVVDGLFIAKVGSANADCNAALEVDLAAARSDL